MLRDPSLIRELSRDTDVFLEFTSTRSEDVLDGLLRTVSLPASAERDSSVLEPVLDGLLRTVSMDALRESLPIQSLDVPRRSSSEERRYAHASNSTDQENSAPNTECGEEEDGAQEEDSSTEENSIRLDVLELEESSRSLELRPLRVRSVDV